MEWVAREEEGLMEVGWKLKKAAANKSASSLLLECSSWLIWSGVDGCGSTGR
jgi:hypothetical protein